MEEIRDICRIQVKFSEIDSMRRVWHGIYAPIYDIQVKCLAPLEMNDVAVIHTIYVPKLGARLDYRYEVYRERDNLLCCKGSTTQLFIDRDGIQLYECPDFYESWKAQYLKS